MRLITKFFLLFQILDILTTMIGLNICCIELNPFGSNIFIFKIFMILGVALILQFKKPTKLDKIVPIVSGIVVPWNILNIILG